MIVVSLNLGLVGCGAIGTTIAKAIKEGKAGENKLISICDVEEEKLENLYIDLNNKKIKKTTDFKEIIEDDKIDLIIEAASQETVKLIAEKTIESKKNIMIMSVGTFSDDEYYNRLKKLAEKNNAKIYAPSGAICGLDGVKAASIENIKSVEITSTKNPKGLEGAPYLIKNKISLMDLKDKKLVFKGSAKTASEGFPKNVNVAVALSLSGIGVEKTVVRIIADPDATRTRHEIKVNGDFGELSTTVNNLVHPNNPKTSYLAALSAIRKLKSLTDSVQIGT